jgi:alpha-methylacyl-CoA racemase
MTGATGRKKGMEAKGPLAGIRVLEFAGIGPGPMTAMLLSDMGAEVLRIDRKGAAGARPKEVPSRGRTSLALNLKQPEAIETCLDLMARVDVVIEGFRPQVMERLGLGPDVALQRNSRLVYGRMTGWGQTGPLARVAAHDLNYIAITGALAAMGPVDRPPTPPLNLVGDFGGGSLYLALGIVAALLSAQESGRGQVVDAAIVDGAASLMAMECWTRAEGFSKGRGANLLDGSAHFYRCYECADGRFISIGAIEPHFYRELAERMKAEGVTIPPAQGADTWQENGENLAAIFRSRSRDEWCAFLEGTDACVAAVLDLEEAPTHPHMAARGAFVESFGVMQPAPAPRFSATPGAIQGPPPRAGEGGRDTALSWGIEGAALTRAESAG